MTRRNVEAIPTVVDASLLEVSEGELKASILLFYSLLDEQQRRLYAGLESLKLGRGGDRSLADFLELDPHTVARGRQQLLAQDVEVDRARRTGGGRKRSGKKTPEIIDAIEILLEHDTAGDPITGLKWTRKTTEKIAELLQQIDYSGFGEYRLAPSIPNGFLFARQSKADRHQLQSLPGSAIPTYFFAAGSLPASRPSDHQRR